MSRKYYCGTSEWQLCRAQTAIIFTRYTSFIISFPSQLSIYSLNDLVKKKVIFLMFAPFHCANGVHRWSREDKESVMD